MFKAIQGLVFWSIILTGVFFAGRISVTSNWFNDVIAENKSKALNKFNDVVGEQIDTRMAPKSQPKKTAPQNKTQPKKTPASKKTSAPKKTTVTESKITPIKKDRVYAGVPRGKKVTLLYNPGFIVGYSSKDKSPLWAAYRVGERALYQNNESPSHFTRDKRVNALSHKAFDGAGYVGAQLASEQSMTTRYGVQAQKHTYLTTNVCAQRESLYEGLWKQLDDKIVNQYASQSGEVWVITGPIFSAQSKKLSSGARVPDKFFKIIVDEKENALEVMAFVFDQNATGHNLDAHLSTVDDIERMTGLDFFTKLSDVLEKTTRGTKTS